VSEPATTDAGSLRILLIDDSEADQLVTQAILAQIETLDCKVEWVPTFETGLEALKTNAHDLVIIDYFLDQSYSGLDLISEARELGIHAPTIMLTGKGSRNVDLEAAKRGASDYLEKGKIDPPSLDRSIRYALERARSERELRDSEERHRGMFDHLPVGLYRASLDGEMVDANPALVRMLGHPGPAVLQEKYAAHLYVNADDRERFWTMLDEYGVVRGFESQLETADGETVRVRNTARLHRGPAGEPLYIEGAVEDISDLRRHEHLKRVEARFRALFEVTRCGIVLVDEDRNIIAANPAVADAMGIGRDELELSSAIDLMAPDERHQLTVDLQDLFEGVTDRVQGERRFSAPDGREFWAHLNCTLIRGPEGNPDQALMLLEELPQDG
jgi:PAS domain S-box-containing protein